MTNATFTPPTQREPELLGQTVVVISGRPRRAVKSFAPSCRIGRVVGPADLAALAVHLMTNTALTGATYDIDGGQQFV
jgi:hypothetical protein